VTQMLCRASDNGRRKFFVCPDFDGYKERNCRQRKTVERFWESWCYGGFVHGHRGMGL
jgi:hypothetical protein